MRKIYFASFRLSHVSRCGGPYLPGAFPLSVKEAVPVTISFNFPMTFQLSDCSEIVIYPATSEPAFVVTFFSVIPIASHETTKSTIEIDIFPKENLFTKSIDAPDSFQMSNTYSNIINPPAFENSAVLSRFQPFSIQEAATERNDLFVVSLNRYLVILWRNGFNQFQ